jgi:hypothetical protein
MTTSPVGATRPAAFLLIGISAAWLASAAPILSGLPALPVVLLTYLGLLGLALLLTYLSDGPGAVRGLLTGLPHRCPLSCRLGRGCRGRGRSCP